MLLLREYLEETAKEASGIEDTHSARNLILMKAICAGASPMRRKAYLRERRARGGKVFATIAPNHSKDILLPIIKDKFLRESEFIQIAEKLATVLS